MRRAVAPVGAVVAGALVALAAQGVLLDGHVRAGLVAAVAVVVLGVALGWSALLALPSPRGSAVVVGAVGFAALGATASADGPVVLAAVPAVLAFGVLAAFAHQLLRRDLRPRVVDGLSGVLAGTLAVTSATGWVAAGAEPHGSAVIVVTAGAVAAACLTSAVGSLGSWRWLATPVLAVAAALALTPVAGRGAPDLGAAAVLGLLAGAMVALIQDVLTPLPAAVRALPALALGLTPVAAAGLLAYAAAHVLGS